MGNSLNDCRDFEPQKSIIMTICCPSLPINSDNFTLVLDHKIEKIPCNVEDARFF